VIHRNDALIARKSARYGNSGVLSLKQHTEDARMHELVPIPDNVDPIEHVARLHDH
jgi:hypothetical protein